jgi:four helix bundle protein
MRKELEERLIRYVILISDICSDLKPSFLSSHLTGQILRSSTSAALNYGEAQAAESRKDFIHKLSLVLKELRETDVNLRIISGTDLAVSKDKIDAGIDESRQLVSIFYRMVQTAKMNKEEEK